MKTLTKYLNERLVINKDYKDALIAPKSFDELRKIIEDRYNELGPGTKNDPIDFNDVDVSNIDSFYDKKNYEGIFESTKFEYIDVSKWDVSNANYMINIFDKCKNLKSIGDLSNWNVSNVKNMQNMFFWCGKLKSVGDLSNWNVSNVEYMDNMFYGCEQLKSVGDLSDWDVSKVKNMYTMFYDSGITNIPDWYK